MEAKYVFKYNELAVANRYTRKKDRKNTEIDESTQTQSMLKTGKAVKSKEESPIQILSRKLNQASYNDSEVRKFDDDSKYKVFHINSKFLNLLYMLQELLFLDNPNRSLEQ